MSNISSEIFEKFNRGIFIVNLLGIIYDPETKKILIGKRENDPHIPNLNWCFPGGRPGYEKELENYLKLEIKKKTNINVEVIKPIFAKTYPEDRRFLSIYYLCEPVNKEAKPMEKFVEVKWIKPTEVKKYFTTSLHERLFRFLKDLEDGKIEFV